MAKNRNIYISYLSRETHTQYPTQRINFICRLIVLILLYFSCVNCGWPSFDNTCKQEQWDYGSNCEDEFQKILDEDSIIVDNTTGTFI